MNLLRIFKVPTLITNKVFNVKTINIKKDDDETVFLKILKVLIGFQRTLLTNWISKVDLKIRFYQNMCSSRAH